MRKLFLILYLSLLSLCSFGQIQMLLAGSGGGGAGVTYLLDEYPGAAAAYALVNLTSSWVGQDVILARRSSDNAELGFTQEEITDGTLIAWVGGGNNGFVKTWYDQSGNGIDATQATTTRQPLLVSAGVVLTRNSSPALKFDGNSDVLTFASQPVLGTTGRTIVVVGGAISTSVNEAIINLGTGGSTGEAYYLTSEIALRVSGNQVWSSNFITTQSLLFHSLAASSNVTDAKLYLNSSLVSVTSSTSATINTAASSAHIGWYIGAAYYDGYLQSIVIYTTDQSANRAAIETIINDIYSIY